MSRTSLREQVNRPRSQVTTGWLNLIENDVSGIDRDIERLVAHYQAQHGYTRDQANAALVQRLSGLVGPSAFPLEDARCA